VSRDTRNGLAFAAVADQRASRRNNCRRRSTSRSQGCLIQGADPKTFVLDNARINPKDSKEVAKRYLMASEVEDMPLKDLVNHEVTATGVVVARSDIRPLPMPPTDKDLPVLTAKSIATIADRCINAGR
jgi:hypothetical protein